MDSKTVDEYVLIYMEETDEELMARLCRICEELGRLPKKEDVPGSYYIKQRLGPWPRVLEKAGLKPVSASVEQKRERNKEKKRTVRELRRMYKAGSNTADGSK